MKALALFAVFVVGCGGDFVSIRFDENSDAGDASGGASASGGAQVAPSASGGAAGKPVAPLDAHSGSGGMRHREDAGDGGGSGGSTAAGGSSSVDSVDAGASSPEAATAAGGAEAGLVGECEPKADPTTCPRCNVVTGGCCTSRGTCGCYHTPLICSD